ncbi:S1 family peptidase [Streptomyces sp. ISL-100]|uniref:S1 family peptidase n=1 Tax=Streptomyces sp. ISL-100 TaxID=2819173 RepID=UPI001BE9376F|nr:S1 family peptidase [Streptomyces sp. ISL-100]MBT2401327.1 hypothetical protein [Streptomyces sp. ISL-100]
MAVHLTPGTETIEPQADRYYDTSPYYGGARFHSYLTTNSATWCTAGFPWPQDGKWYMLTAGHCTTGNGAAMKWNDTDFIGGVVRDNWSNSKGSVRLSCQDCYSGHLSLDRVEGPSSASARIYKGGKRSTMSRPVHDIWWRSVQSGDQLCTGGMMTGERCGWKVTGTKATVKYTSGAIARNVVTAEKTSSACVQKGDSGGPTYTVDGSGRAYAKGIISGGSGGGSDNSGGYLDPCHLIFTDTRLAHNALPGTVEKS